ncbi:hypothetical protein AsAng_0000500 [Aureispira anguillae]|uniref:Uncharacterized protein n=1 Tax=Aureispira anguillae TaxID=2864201 RepID=A0A915VJU3_9BACT|nr:hypothetical protein AsAng_0000500 [Aureispira anguillae]
MKVLNGIVYHFFFSSSLNFISPHKSTFDYPPNKERKQQKSKTPRVLIPITLYLPLLVDLLTKK